MTAMLENTIGLGQWESSERHVYLLNRLQQAGMT